MKYITCFLVLLFVSCVNRQIVPNAVIYNNTCTFSYDSASAKYVNLAGDFNNWDTSSLPMKKVGRKTWVLRMHLNKGIYHYQFIIDKGKRVVPPHADAYSLDGFGGKNAVLIVGNGL